MTELLEPVDNLHRAIDAYELDPNGDGLRDGVNLVLAQIKGTLAKHGCKAIEAAGQAFDPNLHQALQMQPSDEHPANVVMQDLRPGFQLHDRVLRPSQVFVSTGPA
jgi:molecular chaperone GrpE